MQQMNLIETREEWEIVVETIAARNESIAAEEQAMKARTAGFRREVTELQKRLAMVCPHPEAHVVLRQSDIPGSYLDKSQHTKWRECTICGACSEKTTTYGHYE